MPLVWNSYSPSDVRRVHPGHPKCVHDGGIRLGGKLGLNFGFIDAQRDRSLSGLRPFATGKVVTTLRLNP